MEKLRNCPNRTKTEASPTTADHVSLLARKATSESTEDHGRFEKETTLIQGNLQVQ